MHEFLNKCNIKQLLKLAFIKKNCRCPSTTFKALCIVKSCRKKHANKKKRKNQDKYAKYPFLNLHAIKINYSRRLITNGRRKTLSRRFFSPKNAGKKASEHLTGLILSLVIRIKSVIRYLLVWECVKDSQELGGGESLEFEGFYWQKKKRRALM